ncbi:MAG TPA: hypothetical protein VNT26_06375, partial [Candidatus Sulfotelmatobacter sp.]|nr:hypothetical protein [Candidatus Sulfotelmatobacter sp.]
VVVPAGTLGGSGAIQGIVTVGTEGTLAPGGALGTLTINNSLVLGGTTVMEIARNGGVLSSDQVAGLNQVTYGGTLIVTNRGSEQLQIGDTFKLFAASSYAGTFANIVVPGPYTWANKLAIDGTIQVTGAGIPTTPTNLVTVVTGNTLDISWPSNYTGWRLEAQTNSLSVGLSQNWVTVPGSTTTNRLSFQLDKANGTVFFRLVYP